MPRKTHKAQLVQIHDKSGKQVHYLGIQSLRTKHYNSTSEQWHYFLNNSIIHTSAEGKAFINKNL